MPLSIPKKDFDKIFNKLSLEEEKALINELYELDLNDIEKFTYVLKNEFTGKNTYKTSTPGVIYEI